MENLPCCIVTKARTRARAHTHTNWAGTVSCIPCDRGYYAMDEGEYLYSLKKWYDADSLSLYSSLVGCKRGSISIFIYLYGEISVNKSANNSFCFRVCLCRDYFVLKVHPRVLCSIRRWSGAFLNTHSVVWIDFHFFHGYAPQRSRVRIALFCHGLSCY